MMPTGAKIVRFVGWLFVGAYLGAATLPLSWLVMTSVKSKEDSISLRPKLIPITGTGPDRESSGRALAFHPTVAGYASLGDPDTATGRSFFHYLGNSIVIGLISTVATVFIGTGCAYGFSRYSIPGSKDWLFFILSTRFLPPLAVVVPVLMMYREFDLQNTHLGLILLYTSFNLSLAVWLMKGFIDEIPLAYEEAALVDGYTRMHAFASIILPRAAPGMAVTAVFCLISAWNEYGFAMTLNNQGAVTVPVYFAGLQGNVHGLPWPQIAAGALIFVGPIILFTVLVRRHLLRGVTFGTIKQ